MKRLIQVTSMLLIMAIFLTTPAFAFEVIDQRASYYFTSGSAYFNMVSSTRVDVWFDVTATGTMTELGASKIKVQRSTDEVNWTTVQTYYKADYPQMTDDNTTTHDACVPFYYTDGYYYRAVVTLYAKNSNGYGEMDTVSATLDLT